MLIACKMKLHLQNMLNCNGKLIYLRDTFSIKWNYLMLPVLTLCLPSQNILIVMAGITCSQKKNSHYRESVKYVVLKTLTKPLPRFNVFNILKAFLCVFIKQKKNSIIQPNFFLLSENNTFIII